MTRRASPLVLIVTAFVTAACGGSGASAPASPAESQPPVHTPEPVSEPARPSDPPTPSAAPSQAAQSQAPAEGELDWRLQPTYGETDLTSGFSPDPFERAMTSGGPVDVSYLGPDSRGFATVAPAFDVTYEAGALPLLRFYFVADTAEDTTLIINGPDGSWHCNDDAPGTIDPMFDFTNPASGLYDVWIGSYEAGATIEGVLHVTELESYSP